MASVKKYNRIVKRNDDWYVETDASLDGPFFQLNQAEAFKNLKEKAEVARTEFVALLNE